MKRPRQTNPYSGNPTGTSGGNRMGVAPAQALEAIRGPAGTLVKASNPAAQGIVDRAIAHARSMREEGLRREQANREFSDAVGSSIPTLNDVLDKVHYALKEHPQATINRRFRQWNVHLNAAEACTRPDVVERSRRNVILIPWPPT